MVPAGLGSRPGRLAYLPGGSDHAPAAALAGRIPPEAGLLVPIDDETCLFQTGTNSLLGLVTYVTKLGVGFTAINPPELRELLRQLAASYSAAAE